MKKTILFLAIAALFCSCDNGLEVDDPTALPVGMHTVDLGLPSGIKWAKCNLGSTSPEKSGYWFSWGSPVGYKFSNVTGDDVKTGDLEIANVYDGAGTILEGGFDYNNFYNNGLSSMFYITPESNHDAARNLLGENWRLPTVEEFNELLDPNNTESQWVENYDNTGVNGWLFKSVRPGYNEPLFFPASGDVSDNSLYSENIGGVYWSSTNQGASLYFSKDDDMLQVMEYFFGFFGGSVRAVYSEQPSEGIKGIKLGKSSVSMNIKDKLILTATVETEPNVINKDVLWESSDESVVSVYRDGTITARAEGTATITATTFFGGFTATCEVSVFKENNGHAYVDLGLPSGTKWSTMNVGSNSPSDLGGYYAWGETSVDVEYVWEAYDLCALSNTDLIKYNTSKAYGRDMDNKTVLEASDDVASKDWGSTWRIPTDEEWKELVDNCNWTWASMGGISGYKVQSKSDASKWIFLPASGQTLGLWPDGYGTDGHYWSSSLRTESPDEAYAFDFNGSGKSVSSQQRCYGLTVRPVFK